MVAGEQVTPLVVVVGQTGAGKSALAMELAQQFDGEIIAADSRTVYKEMDIGTAKPSAKDRQLVAHYGLDVVNPEETFTAADFKQLATDAIRIIASRGRVPFVVGGTGLYIDALLYDFTFRPLPNVHTRTFLEALPVEELQKQITAAGLALPRNSTNPRHLRRILESGPAPLQPRTLRPNTLIFGLRTSREQLYARLSQRVDDMVAAGFVHEVQTLMGRHGDAEALRAPGYKAFARYVGGEVTLDEAKQAFVANDMRLAKRQLTWFKRNEYIHWLDGDEPLNDATQALAAFLDTTGPGF